MSSSLESQPAPGASEPQHLWCEQFRPSYHYTPARNWMNDPNGLVYFEGEYHLFYQYNPHERRWGHMSWGHAVSADLIHWHELPVAIPEREFMIFSGCALIDWVNSTGLGDGRGPPMLAYFTAHDAVALRQTQHLAYSHDRGRTWIHYNGNPLIDLGLEHFRDPKVFWHAASSKWVMTVALPGPHQVQIYTSGDLLAWKLASEFGPAGAVGGQWECPDLFEAPVLGRPGQRRWVLKVDVDKDFIGPGSGAQYFVGDFDGERFSATEANGKPLAHTVDCGADFYAAMTWSDLPTGSEAPIWIGWLCNHLSGHFYPTEPWRGSQSIPRELFLFEEGAGLRLGQRPVPQLSALRRGHRRAPAVKLVAGATVPLSVSDKSNALELTFRVTPAANSVAGLKLIDQAGGEISIGVDSAHREVFVDRTRCGTNIHPGFPLRHATTYTYVGAISFCVFIDACSVEVFIDGGRRVISDSMFPKGSLALSLFSDRSAAHFEQIEIYELASIHK